MSASGRYVAFESMVQLVAADRNQLSDIYVYDRVTGELTLESAGPAFHAGIGWSEKPDISADGRYLVFESTPEHVLPGSETQVFLRDRKNGMTRLLSCVYGHPLAAGSRNAAISADGTTIVFASGDAPTDEAAAESAGIYLVRLDSQQLMRVDIDGAGMAYAGHSTSPAISSDGRFVAFVSNLDPACGGTSACAGDAAGTPRISRVYVHDVEARITTAITRSYDGGQPDGASYHPSISADGRYVAFASEATNLTRTIHNRIAQIYVHDRATGTTELVSRRRDGVPGDGPSRFPAISGDGSTIAFQSLASDLMCRKRCSEDERDINLVFDVYMFDRASGKVTRASHDGSGMEWMAPSRGPSLDHTGRVLAFSSRHPTDDDDVAHDDDLYVYTSIDPSDPHSSAKRKRQFSGAHTRGNSAPIARIGATAFERASTQPSDMASAAKSLQNEPAPDRPETATPRGPVSENTERREAEGATAWRRVQIRDPSTRAAALRALNAASEWLESDRCQSIFSDLLDGRGMPLVETLRVLELTPVSYLGAVYFLDGMGQRPCSRDGVLAFTVPHSRVIYLCGREFERVSRENIREAQATIIHEILHTLGLGENPPTPRSISRQVAQRCAPEPR